jgi:PKD repeat protein
LTAAYGNNVTNSSLAYSHSMNLTGLQDAALYYYNITACDVLGNCASYDDSFTTLVHVNQAPVVNITLPPDANKFQVGTQIDFTGTAVDLEDGTLSGTALVWSSDIDGVFGTGNAYSTSSLSVGNHTITLTATDLESLDGTDTITIEVSSGAVNNDPVATINSPASLAVVAAGDNVVLNGSATDWEDGVLTGTALAWTSNVDGALGTGEVVTTALTAGGHVITLTATDSQTATGTDTISLFVRNKPVPAITAPANNSIFANGTQVDFTGSATDAEDGTLTGNSLVWSSSIDGALGNGTSVSTSTLSVGNHTITLTAVDSDNMTGQEIVELEITSGAVNYPPTVSITSPADLADLDAGVVSLVADAQDTEDGALTGTAINWTSSIEGNLGTGSPLPATLTVGTHTITVVVTDSGNKTATDSITLYVFNPSHLVNSRVDGILYTDHNGNIDNGQSLVLRSNVIDSTVTTSVIRISQIERSTIKNSQITNSTVLDSWIENSIVEDAFIDPSIVINSTVSPDSNVTDSNVTNSDVNGSNVNDAVVDDSVLDGVDVTNSTVNNTDLEDVVVDDATIVDDVIYNGTIQADNGTVIYNNGGPMNVTDVINYEPVANAGPDKTGNVGRNVTFDGSASTDANFASSTFNESLTYQWNFGDGNSASGVQASHAYNATGTYNTTLTVTDSKGASHIDTVTVTITQRSSGGGSSGGSSSPDEPDIVLDDFEEVPLTLRKGKPVQFLYKNEVHTVTLESYDSLHNTARFTIASELPATFILHVGETKKLDVDGGDYYDIAFTLTKMGNSIQATIQRIHELMPGARPPLPVPEPEPEVEVEPEAEPDPLPEPVLTKRFVTPILVIILSIFIAADIMVLLIYLTVRFKATA